jgi:hypothetical protein
VQAERDTVARAEADVAFRDGRHVHAARLWGRIRASDPSFEEVALRFVGVGATEALQAFLMARLQVLSPDDKAQVGASTIRLRLPEHWPCLPQFRSYALSPGGSRLAQQFRVCGMLWQATMVASWVVELYLDQINRALLEETAEASSSGEALANALRDFLRDHVDILDVNVTIGLLASYGRLDDLMHYATYRQVRQQRGLQPTCGAPASLWHSANHSRWHLEQNLMPAFQPGWRCLHAVAELSGVLVSNGAASMIAGQRDSA